MAAHPDVPADVLDAAIAAAGEVRRYYPHLDSDFRTDVSHMLYAALVRFVTPIGASSRYFFATNPCAEVPRPSLGPAEFAPQPRWHERPETD